MISLVANEAKTGSIILEIGGKAYIEIESNGKFYVQGREAGMDRVIYDGFRKFLIDSGYIKDERNTK